jgi:hypothetical protein
MILEYILFTYLSGQVPVLVEQIKAGTLKNVIYKCCLVYLQRRQVTR